jgi:polysaccharide export outer membrane protein
MLAFPRLISVAFAAAVAAAPLGAQDGPGSSDQAARAALLHPRPGDRVVLKVYGDPTLSDGATVDELGRITLPKIGTIQADRFTAAGLRDTIRARMSTYVVNPAIEVGVMRRVVVSGEVARPGVYFAELTTSLGELVAQAGGLRESGHPSKVYVVRGGERIKVDNWQADRSPASDLRSGDQVLVGRRSWLALNIIPVVSVGTSVVALTISLLR